MLRVTYKNTFIALRSLKEQSNPSTFKQVGVMVSSLQSEHTGNTGMLGIATVSNYILKGNTG